MKDQRRRKMDARNMRTIRDEPAVTASASPVSRRFRPVLLMALFVLLVLTPEIVRAQTSNSSPTGVPTIAGEARAGRTVAVVTLGIADADGLENATFSYQWVRNDGTTDTDIAGATKFHYRLVDADLGKTIKVRVSFTDDAGNTETLTSAPTTEVVAGKPGPPRNLALSLRVGEIAVSWDASANNGGGEIINYKVQWRMSGEEYHPSDEAVVGTSTRSRTITGLVGGYTYVVRVVAVNGNGDGRPSAEARGTVVYSADVTAPLTRPRFVTVEISQSGALAVFWINPASDGGKEILRYKVQWKPASEEDYDSSDEAIVDGSSRSRTITGLVDDSAYTVRVVAVNGDGDGPPSAEVTEAPTDLLEVIEDVVDTKESNNAWLRPTLRYMNEPPFEIMAGDASSFEQNVVGVVAVECFEVYGLPDCEAGEMRMRRGHFNTGNIVHEMAHVFTLTPSLPAHPGPMGMALLHFLELAGHECDPSEILADAFALSVSHGLQLTFWGACNSSYSPGNNDALTTKTLATVRSAVAGQTPRWFEDTYDDAGDTDLEQVWTDLNSMGAGTYTDVTIRLFGGTFGGYCDDRKVGHALRYGTGGITNPWRDGGCVPGAPADATIVSGADDATLSWTTPGSAGGALIEGYKVEWKYPGEEYDASRRAVVTDLSNLSFTVGGLNVGTSYTFRVRAFNTFGDGAYSAEIMALVEGAPVILGTARSGRTLAAVVSGIADADGIADAEFSYQWISSDGTTDTEIVGATNHWYRLTDDEVGKTIKVRVTFTDDADNEEVRVSAATAEVAPRPNNRATGTPTIVGETRVDETMTVDISSVADADGLDSAEFSYQWTSSDGTAESDIEDATGATYTLVEADKGRTIKVRVSFTDDRGHEEALTSEPTAEVYAGNRPATGRPTVAGTARSGRTLAAVVSGIGDADGMDAAELSYQWISSDGTTDTEIVGATNRWYRLTDDEVGKTIKVTVTFTDDRDHEETLVSEPTAEVLAARSGE